MNSRYWMFARSNAWRNERPYDAAATIPDPDYRADRGAFCKSLHDTLWIPGPALRAVPE